MLRLLIAAFCALALVPEASAQQFDFSGTAAQDPAILSMAVTNLAIEVLPVYKEADRETYLTNLAALQAAAGRYNQAAQSYEALRDFRRSAHISNSEWRDLQYEIYDHAKATAKEQKLPFNDSYRRTFRATFAKLNDVISARAMPLFNVVDESWMTPTLQSELNAQKDKTNITLDVAVSLIRDYEAVQAYRETTALRPALITEDDSRRYVIAKDIQVKTADGATVCAFVARQRASVGRLPALFFFSIYYDPADTLNDVRLPAAHGYASVAGFTRGKACSPDKPVPYEHDGADAASVIDWITAQPWSDGRVGMYSGSYNGFTQWATAKYMPKGLKAMMNGAPAAPGIDVPMEGECLLELHISLAALYYEREGQR
jgi:hypothetical protein